MLGSIKRSNPLKKWTQIFTERVDDIKSEKQKRREAYSRKSILPSAMEDSSTIASEESSINQETVTISQKSISQQSSSSSTVESIELQEQFKALPTCKRSEHNVAPPAKQLDWKRYWGSQLVCYICTSPALNDCVVCHKCNMICHRLCLLQVGSNVIKGKNFGVTFKAHNLSSHSLAYEVPIYEQHYKRNLRVNKHHKCPYCEEAYVADMKNFHELVERLREEKLRELCASLITRRVLVFLERCRFINKKRSIIHIQAIVRGVFIRKKFRQSLRTKPRLSLIKVFSIPTFLRDISNTLQYHKDYIVVVTIHDTFKNSQLFRFERTYESILHETIFIPGITYNQSIVINFGLRDENNPNGNNYYWLFGQAHIGIRDIRRQIQSSDVTLNIIDKITVSCISIYAVYMNDFVIF